jgi:hypothetical protein
MRTLNKPHADTFREGEVFKLKFDDPRHNLRAPEPEVPPNFDELCELEDALRYLANTAIAEHERHGWESYYCANRTS